MTGQRERLVELAEAVAVEAETSRGLLRRIVGAKRSGEPDQEAWAEAVELVTKWVAEDGGVADVQTTGQCPECRAVLAWGVVSLDGRPPQNPHRIECGPEHIIRFVGYSIGYEAGRTRVFEDATVAPHVSVFGTAEGGEGDADVQG